MADGQLQGRHGGVNAPMGSGSIVRMTRQSRNGLTAGGNAVSLLPIEKVGTEILNQVDRAGISSAAFCASRRGNLAQLFFATLLRAL
jgi:hypothetical protein